MRDNNKKILMVSNMYPSKKYPHYGVFVRNTAEILRNAGYVVDVVAIKKTENTIRKLFVYIGFYWSVVWKGTFGKYSGVYAHYASHTALPLLILNKLRKLPIVINVHGNDVVPETEADKRYMGLVAKILSKGVFVITPSEYFKKEVIKRFNVPEKKIGVYPSGGVDTDKFRGIERTIAIEYLQLAEDKRYIGYVSRIEENKGWDIFLKACKKLIEDYEDIKLIVVGDGKQAKEYNELVDKLGLREHIIKYELLSQEKIVYIFNVLDVFVFSTYRKSESLGLVGLEAMACETTTVLPDAYGPASYGKNEENAFVFKAGDEASLEITIRRALNNSNKDIRRNARKTALSYNNENSNKTILEMLSGIF